MLTTPETALKTDLYIGGAWRPASTATAST